MQTAKRSALSAYLTFMLMVVFYITFTTFFQPAEAKCLMINGSDGRCLDGGMMSSIEQQQQAYPQSDLIVSSATNYSSLILLASISAILIGVSAAVFASKWRSSNSVIGK